jgi:hypothetical protein
MLAHFACSAIIACGRVVDRSGQGRLAMPHVHPTATADRATWHVGQRVVRKNTQELGTVVEHNGSIKVKWDAGRTSYFRHSETANVKLKAASAKR